MGQRGGAIDRGHRDLDVAIDLRRASLVRANTHQLQVAGNAGEQIVEIVRQPASQLADCLHLERLPQRILDPLTLLCLGLQPGIRCRQLAGPLGYRFLQRTMGAEAVYGSRQQVGVAPQEKRIALGELARDVAVDLEDAERRLSLAANDDNIGDRPDIVVDQELRIPEPGFRRDVGGDHRLPCLESMAFRRVGLGRDGRHTDNTGLPANTRAH